MPSVTGVALAGALLLFVGGVAKLARPRTLARSLDRLGLPYAPLAVRVGGAAEAVLALLAGAGSTRVAWALVAASYAGFTGFVGYVRRRGGALASCGCFGGADTPATLLHAAVTGGYAVAAALAAADPPDLRAAAPGGAVGVAAVGAVLAYLSYAALGVLPRVRALAVKG